MKPKEKAELPEDCPSSTDEAGYNVRLPSFFYWYNYVSS